LLHQNGWKSIEQSFHPLLVSKLGKGLYNSFGGDGEEVHVRGDLKKERSALDLTRRFTARGDLKKDRLTLFC
jgi:hypothetical protein